MVPGEGWTYGLVLVSNPPKDAQCGQINIWWIEGPRLWASGLPSDVLNANHVGPYGLIPTTMLRSSSSFVVSWESSSVVLIKLNEKLLF